MSSATVETPTQNPEYGGTDELDGDVWASRGLRVSLEDLAAAHDERVEPILAWARTRLRQTRPGTTFLTAGFLAYYASALSLSPGELYVILWELGGTGDCHIANIDDIELAPADAPAAPAEFPSPVRHLPRSRPAADWGEDLVELAHAASLAVCRSGDVEHEAVRAAVARRDAVVSIVNGLAVLGRANAAARLAIAWWDIADLPGIGREESWLDELEGATEDIRAAELGLRCHLAQAAGDATYRLGEFGAAHRHWSHGAQDGQYNAAALPLLHRLLALALATPQQTTDDPEIGQEQYCLPRQDPRDTLISMAYTYAGLGDPQGEGWTLTRCGLVNLARHDFAVEDFAQARLFLRAAAAPRFGTDEAGCTHADLTVLLGRAEWQRGRQDQARGHWYDALTEPDLTHPAHARELLALTEDTGELPPDPYTEAILGAAPARARLDALTTRSEPGGPYPFAAAFVTAC